MTIRIRLKHIDNSTPYNYPTRSIDIQTNKGHILTPARAVTSYEYNQKTLVPSDVTLDDKVSLSFSRYSGTNLEKFLQNDGPFESLSNRLRIHKERSYSHLNLALIKPIFTAAQLNNEKSFEKFFRLTIQAQLLHRFDLISVYVPKIPTTYAKKFMTDVDKRIEKENTRCIFFFELGQNFPQLLDHAVTTLGHQLLGFHHKRFDRAIQSYDAIRNYSEKDVAFMAVNTTRYDGRYNDLSTMHYLPFLSNDIFTSMIPSPPIPNENTPSLSNQDRLSRLRLFNRDKLTLDPTVNVSANVDKLLIDIGRPGDNSLHDMLTNWQDAGRSGDDLKLRRLSAFTKVHESKVSSSEFVKLTKRIRNRESKYYIDEPDKSNIKSAIDKIERRKR